MLKFQRVSRRKSILGTEAVKWKPKRKLLSQIRHLNIKKQIDSQLAETKIETENRAPNLNFHGQSRKTQHLKRVLHSTG